ncbi:isochorismatase family protein [Parabacteroides faecis]|uniref:isochorismatase family protein n=1 Tax=Parabacteroides faecis TaxID=1217282 RepID=UPI0021640E4E|nr:isochorismatase family protein [Parabacteroides faecis]MCS2890991.1 isochorismatase family protein [Parabacteroides faecis]UVQ45356.1 isochorismatase family protein [Parabacteroides faecis]
MRIRIMLTMIVAFLLCLSVGEATVQKKKTPDPLKISTQQRIPSDFIPGSFFVSNRIENWKPNETAIIICDMWDKHWCKGATARVAEMAPALNEVLILAREKGVTIVHAPSDCMDYYKDYPGRKKIAGYKDKKISELANGEKLPAEENAAWPVDQSDEGCDDDPSCQNHRAWTKQIDALTIQENDLISDSGSEIGTYFKKKGIKNVILAGVHTNMCVIGRSFGLRAMKKMGMNVVLMRDMTDLMYNHRRAPKVDHFSGLDLMVEYIEKYVCPTIVSSDFTGKKQFCFQGDKRPRIAFVTAESEYHANVRLLEFAHELTLNNIHSDFALGVPVMTGPGRHNLENLQILEDADLAVIFTRRRALEPEKMRKIKEYVASGRPLLGIRTASHAFDAKGNVPREGGGVVTAQENASDLLAQWPEFDKEILGGNYTGHYGHLKTGTDVKVVPGMENHPILKGVASEFNSPSWLYKNRPLRTGKATILLLGSNPGVPDEPVMWINGKNVVYTSLGHWDDWKNESFRNLMFNTVDYLLNNSHK